MDTRTDGHTLTDKPQTNATVALMHLAGLPYRHSTPGVARDPQPHGSSQPPPACEGRDRLCPWMGEGGVVRGQLHGSGQRGGYSSLLQGNGLMWGTTTQDLAGLAASSLGDTRQAAGPSSANHHCCSTQQRQSTPQPAPTFSHLPRCQSMRGQGQHAVPPSWCHTAWHRLFVQR